MAISGLLLTMLSNTTSVSDSSGSSTSFSTRLVGFLCALAAPLCVTVVSMFDKLAVSRRVQSTQAYVALVGTMIVLWGIILNMIAAATSQWQHANVSSKPAANAFLLFLYPILAGVGSGLSALFWFFALVRSDVSVVSGFQYLYVVPLAILTWIFLGDKFTVFRYLGMGFTITGAVLLSVNWRIILKNIKEHFDNVTATAPADQRVEDAAPSSELSSSTTELSDCKREIIPPQNTVTVSDGSPAGTPNSSVTEDSVDSPSIPNSPVIPPVPPQEIDQMQKEPSSSPTTSNSSSGTTITANAQAKKKHGRLWTIFLLLLPLVFFSTINSFFTAVASEKLGTWCVSGIIYLAYGLTMLATLVFPEARQNYVRELRANWWVVATSELCAMLGNVTTVQAMSRISAPIVSSLAATQPLIVLCLELIFRLAERTSWWKCITFKLFPISLILVGVVFISFAVLD